MRIHRISIENFRGVNRFDVDFDVDGVTIVEGDNEIGKSCIPEALRMVLDTLDSAKSKPVKAVKPVHRDVGPEVEVDISTGQYRFVLTKRWLVRPSTTLVVQAPRREQLTGREAHDRVQEILDETLDHDLLNALNVEQGSDLGLPNFNVPALGRALDAAAGGQISTARDDGLWDRIVAERNRYWNANDKAKSDRTALAERVDRAATRVAAFAGEIDSVETDVAEVARLESELPGLESQLKASLEHDAGLAERWQNAERSAGDLRIAQADFDLKERSHVDASQLLADRKALVDSVEAAAANLRAIEQEARDAEPARHAIAVRHREAERALEEARREVSSAEQEHHLAVADSNHVRQRIEVEQLTERLDAVQLAELDLLVAQEVSGRIRVTPELVAEIDERYLEAERADAAVNRGVPVVRAEILGATTLLIDGSDADVDCGDVLERSVSRRLDLEIPGVLRLAIEAGSDAEGLATEASRLRESYLEACRAAGVASLDEARAQLEELRKAQEVDAASRKTIASALRDLTPTALESKINGLTAAIGEYHANRPHHPPMPASHDDAQAVERCSRESLEGKNRECRGLETEHALIAGELREAELVAATSKPVHERARQDLVEVEQRLRDERDMVDDDRLAAVLIASKEEVRIASEALDRAKQAVAEMNPELLGDLISNAAAATERLRSEIDANRHRCTEIHTRLDLRGEQGLQHQLDEATSELTQLKREHVALERHASVALCLYEVSAQARDNVRRRYHEPFRRQIERLASILYEDSFEVELDGDLRIARRTLGGRTLDFNQLSAGAREQLGIISRLACATIVSAHGGAPVILDDTLGWTDPTRLAAMGAIIAVAGKGCQVVVLTCTPGRYSSVGSAHVIRLAEGALAGAPEIALPA